MNLDNPFAAARQRMIDKHLRARGITSQHVLAAMAHVPRERFLPDRYAADAYSDQALSIDCGQTISQPYIVALMTEALGLSGGEHVLEVGTGSGYQTAVLAELAGDVVSIERHAELSAHASNLLEQLGYTNVKLIVGDGAHGCPQQAPFDRIIVTAAATHCPPALLDQLREGGVLVGPFGPADSQMLQKILKLRDASHIVTLTPCRFVPLISDDEA